ncbi:MAG: hypothetical protein K2L94_04180 [Alphaproteobacteria bacterium]|nr:hypothetical protein [Alphaproteobacteria bacterium]
MSAEQKANISGFFWGWILGTGIGIGIASGVVHGAGYYSEHKDDEKGTVIDKTDAGAVIVDTNGDKNPDRAIYFNDEYVPYYTYVQTGDQISYTNRGYKAVLTVGKHANKIRKINGKSLDEINQWNELNRHVKMKTR